jgi:acetyl esterase/lipase
VLGVSRGAEAALLTAVHDPRVDLSVAISPTDVVWQSTGAGLDGAAWPPRSSFTWGGEALPFMVYDPRAWPLPDGSPPAYRSLHETSLVTFAEDVAAATIPIERARAEIILAAGAGDKLWPSDTAAREIAARLTLHGKQATVIEHPNAGHSPVFPGEIARPSPTEHAWGGTPEADRALGQAAWTEITRRLSLPD